MKKLILVSIVILLCALPAMAQHSVTLGWTPSTDASNPACPTLCSNQILRAPAACSTNPTFAQIGTAPATASTFVDSTPSIGNACYVMTFTVSGIPSVDSNTVSTTIQPAAPTGLKVTSQQ